MKMLNSTGELSWIATSFLCPRDAERELVALREQPVLNADLLRKRTARARRYKQESDGEKRPWRSPSPSAAILPTQGCLAPFRSLTTDQVIEKCQEEVRALHQALAHKPNYRLAQRSMYRLGDLEIVLWEAFSKERFSAAQVETRKLKRAQNIERTSLEAELKERESQLWAGCKRQADALRKEYQVRLAFAHATIRGACQDASTAEESTVTNVSTNPADTSSESEIRGKGVGVENPRRFRENRGECRIVQSTPTAFPNMAAAAMGRARAKEKMARHFAVVTHAEGGHHLQDASRVVASIEELEEKARQEGRVRTRYSLDHPEKGTLLQQQLQAEAIQKQKHNRLLRNHERSRDEIMRLLFVRNHRALRHLSERRQVETRRRKEELHRSLFVVKGEVTRAWRTHNRSRGITVKPESIGRMETSAEPSKLEANPSSGRVVAAAVTQSGLKRNELLASRHPVAMKEATVISEREVDLANTIDGSKVIFLPSFGQQEAEDSHNLDQAFSDQDRDCGDAGGGDSRDSVLSNADRVVGGSTPRKANSVAEPSLLESRAEDEVDTEPLLHNPEVSIDSVGARGFGVTSLRQGEVDGQLQAPITEAVPAGDVIAGMSSGGSSVCLGSPKGQNGEARHGTSGACTSGDTANGDARTKDPENATTSTKSFTRKRRATCFRKKRRGADVVTGCIPTFPKAAVTAPVGGLGSVIGVLSAAEANALLALGRSAPDDPDVLLTSRAQPLERWANVVRQGDVQDGNEVVVVFEDGNFPEDTILDRAVDKLVSEIREEENSNRRRLGMAPLIF